MRLIFRKSFVFMLFVLFFHFSLFGAENSNKSKKMKNVYLSKNQKIKTTKTKKKQTTSKIKKESVSYFSNFQVGGGIEGGGPLFFKDTPDQTLDKTTVFLYGGKISFLFGHYKNDVHKVGLETNFNLIAKSKDRTLMYLSPALVYSVGFPFVLESSLGYTIALGTKDFAENYSGIFSGIELKYVFNNNDSSPVLISLGLTGKFILPIKDMTYANSFAGISLEIMYRTDNK